MATRLSRSSRTRAFPKHGLVVFLILITGLILTIILAEKNIKTELITCKVIELKEQQKYISNSNSIYTDIRFLIITDKETLICESNLFALKFNNSDIFYRLKRDSTYTFKVTGVGKSALIDYRNIVEIVR